MPLRIPIKNTAPNLAANAAAASTLEVPWAHIATLVTAIGGLSALFTAIANYYGEKPKTEAQLVREERCLELGMLGRALSVTDSGGRRASVELLAASGMLSNPSAVLDVVRKSTPPQWSSTDSVTGCATNK